MAIIFLASTSAIILLISLLPSPKARQDYGEINWMVLEPSFELALINVEIPIRFGSTLNIPINLSNTTNSSKFDITGVPVPDVLGYRPKFTDSTARLTGMASATLDFTSSDPTNVIDFITIVSWSGDGVTWFRLAVGHGNIVLVGASEINFSLPFSHQFTPTEAALGGGRVVIGVRILIQPGSLGTVSLATSALSILATEIP